MALSAIERRLLAALEDGLPLAPRPYRALGERAGLGEAEVIESLRSLVARGVIRRPEDLGISALDADRSLLAARSIKDLVHWSGGLYEPPAKFRNW